MHNYRIIKATNLRNQICNEAGPGLKEVQLKCEQIMSKLQNMNQDNQRDTTVLSNTMMKLLAEEADTDNDYHAMHALMEEYRANYALLYREETLRSNDVRNEMIDNTFTDVADEGTRKDYQDSNEYEENDDMSEVAESRLYGNNQGRSSYQTDNEEKDSGKVYKDDEEEEELS